MADRADEKCELSEETKKFMYQWFKMRDMDDSGTLDKGELAEALPIMGFYPTEDELDWIIKTFDKNKNGKLEIKELMANLRVLNEQLNNKEKIKAAFKMFDTSGDGCIRLPELLKVLTFKGAMDPEEASKLLDELVEKHDTNHDGKFNFEEFVNIYLDDSYRFIEEQVKREAKKSRKS